MQRSLRLRDTKTIRPQVTVGEGIPATEHWTVFEFVPRLGVRDSGGRSKKREGRTVRLSDEKGRSGHGSRFGSEVKFRQARGPGMVSDVESSGSQRRAWLSRIVPAAYRNLVGSCRLPWLFVALGILTRLVRYLVDYPIWHDEAFLAVNFWDRDYAGLLRPLDYGQVAPWLFLVVERTAVIWLGYSEMVLRLIPAVCGMLSVLVFYHVSGRLLHGQARLLAVAVFAVSFYPIRHGAEIKPYASDLLAALVLLALAIEWLRDRDASRWWWLMTGAAPFLVALSYPVVFVAGGVSLALARPVFQTQKAARAVGLPRLQPHSGRIIPCRLLLLRGNFQEAVIGAHYRQGCWAESFPPFERPWMLPIWLLDMHTGTMMAYPVGDKHGGSVVTFLLVVAGARRSYRQDRKASLAMLLAPFALGLLAAALGKYPYGGTARTMQYVAPSICLLMGLGMSELMALIPWDNTRRRAMASSLVALGRAGVRHRRSRPCEAIPGQGRRGHARLRALVLEGKITRRGACVREDRPGHLVQRATLEGGDVGGLPVSPAALLRPSSPARGRRA